MQTTTKDDAINLLEATYEFRDQLAKLYNDIQMRIKEICQKNSCNISLEKWPNIDWMHSNQLLLQYFFAANGQIFGISLLIAVDPTWIKTGEHYYKFVNDLQIDSRYPLVLIYGIYKPIDINNYNPHDWFLVVTGLNNSTKVNMPINYKFNNLIEIKTDFPKESYYWYESCKVKIKNILDIQNQDGIKDIVNDLFDQICITNKNA